jgi:hypothetical protein
MPSPGASLENLLLRHSALSVIVQGLMDTLLTKGLLDQTDILAVRRYAMDLSRDLLDASSAEARAAGVRLGEEVEAFLHVVVGSDVQSDGDEERP